MLEFYKRLIEIRRTMPAIACPARKNMHVEGHEQTRTLVVRRWRNKSEVLCIFNYHSKDTEVKVDFTGGHWSKLLDSAESEWKGPGSALPRKAHTEERMKLKGKSFALYTKEHTR